MSQFQLGSNLRQLLQMFPASTSDLNRNTILSVCIARAIASQLPLPTSPVNEINSHYTLTHSQTVMELVSSYNETIIIDVRLTMDLAFKFYRLRYDVCHGVTDTPNLLSVISVFNPDNFPKQVNDVLKRENQNPGEDLNSYYMLWDDAIQACVREIKERERALTGGVSSAV